MPINSLHFVLFFVLCTESLTASHTPFSIYRGCTEADNFLLFLRTSEIKFYAILNVVSRIEYVINVSKTSQGLNVALTMTKRLVNKAARIVFLLH
jgi:hypothetical protein